MSARKTTRQPFSLVPWEQDFLEALADELIRDYAPDLGQVLIIFPHARPARYLRRILAARTDLPKPCLLPAMYALPRFISDLAAQADRGGGTIRSAAPNGSPSPAPTPSLTRIGDGRELSGRTAESPAGQASENHVFRVAPPECPPGRRAEGYAINVTPSPAPTPSLTRIGDGRELSGRTAESPGGYAFGENTPRQTAHVLDQVAVLREVVLAVAEKTGHEGLAATAGDARRFLPWGVRLAGLMEDIFSAAITPATDFSYLDGSVPPFAVALLENLTAIHAAYILELDRRLLTTPGYDGRLVVEVIRGGGNRKGRGALSFPPPRTPPPSLTRIGGEDSELSGRTAESPGLENLAPEIDWEGGILQGRQIILAGFYGLTGVEDCLFRHLWQEHGARVFLHTDARIATAPETAHWSCAAHAAWLKNWNAAVRVLVAPDGAASAEEQVASKHTFHQGYDLHSQLTRLHEVLAETGAGADAQDQDPASGYENSAVVLPDSGLLMPLLHHLPGKNINISMGYPLERSALARLVELILRLQESRRDIFQDDAPQNAPAAQLGIRRGGVRGGEPQGDYPLEVPLPGVPAYHWRAVLNLLRHPYLRMLERDGERRLQAALGVLERLVRSGARFVDPAALLASPECERELVAAGLEPEPVRAMLGRLLELTVAAWEGVDTVGGAARNLAGLADFLAEEGRDLWPRFPLDGEYLFRLREHLAPQLAQSAFADVALDRDALFAVLREAVRGERVPFEADPLEGLQVLGMLETRLLSFERVFILDATDDRLPGAPAYDPLAPDALRREMGLPGLSRREEAMAYTFNRLVRAAREVEIFYQTGAGSGGLLDEKKIRSRFVEELVWDEEKRRGALLKAGEPPLFNIAFKITPAASVGRGIAKSEAAARRLEIWLQKPVSPTALDAYLQCPARFFYERLAGLNPPDVVREGDDPAGVGEFLHAALQEFFSAYLNAPLPDNFPRVEDERRLAGIYLHRLAASAELAASLPYASYLMLKTTGLARLMGMLRKTPPGVNILSLESGLEAPLVVSGRKITLHGKLDRADLRRGGKPQGDNPL